MRLWFGLLILLSSSWMFGQECTRYMVVDVFDRKTSHGVDALKAANFAAKLDGQAVPVVSATQNFNNRILVLVETSGPSDEADGTRIVHEVTDQAHNAPSGKKIAFGAYSKKSAFTKGFVADKQLRAAAIDEVMTQEFSTDERFALYDALHEALLMFGDHQPGDTILLVSDGFDNNSRRSGSDLEKELIASGVRLNVVIRKAADALGRHLEAGVGGQKLIARGDLRSIASLTGGMYVWGVSERALEFTWAGYLIGVQMPAGLRKAKPLVLEFRNASGKPSKDAWIAHPFEVAPCAAGIAMR
jgi:hypothetical protein